MPAGLYREVAGNYGPRLASTQLRWCESGRGVAGTAHLRQRRSLRSTFAKRSLRSPLRLAGSLAPVGSLRMPLRNSLASQPKPASEASGLAKAGGEGGIRTPVPVTRQDAFEAPPLRPLRYLSALGRTFIIPHRPAHSSRAQSREARRHEGVSPHRSVGSSRAQSRDAERRKCGGCDEGTPSPPIEVRRRATFLTGCRCPPDRTAARSAST